MEEEPERLAEVKGISEKKAREIAAQMEEKKDMRKAMIFLQQYGISTTLGVKIYNQYGNNIYQVIKENPYQMADDINGVGFRIADEIASKVGIHTDSDYRIRCGLLYVLQQAMSEGHVFLPKEILEKEPWTFWESARRLWKNTLWIWPWTGSWWPRRRGAESVFTGPRPIMWS